MKYIKYLVFVISLLIILPSCQQEKKMRRFTFATYNSLSDSIAFQNLKSDKVVLDELAKSGVVNFNYCSMDSISYLVLDMEEDFNLDRSIKVFNDLALKYSQLGFFTEILNGNYQLLDRIYKMEQTIEYAASSGQLIPYQKADYGRFILTLEIINDPVLAEEYIKVHGIGMAWPQITENMKSVGIHEMELYLMGYRAFLIMDTKPDFDWDIDGKVWGDLPKEKDWQAYVAKFQKTNPESKAAEKWKTMKLISMH